MDREPPHYLVCPITFDIMERPVVAPDGRAYEEDALRQWMTNNNTSPVTGAAMPAGPVHFSYNLRDASQEHLIKQPLAIEPDRLTLTDEVIGRGSFGHVVGGTLRTHGARDRQVAVKTLPELGGDDARRAFEKELKAHMEAQQGADGVCRLFGTCLKDGKLCLVMKRYEGNLTSRIREGMDADAIRRTVHRLCETLEQLHAAGIVVKDIKPDNILFDATGRPHFADFGISVVMTQATKFVPTSVSGTFNYLAPEAYNDQGFGVEVDIWAMGCLLIEMCTGIVPWQGLQMQQIMMAVAMKRKIPPIPDHVPEPEMVRKCFAYNPKERPTATELARTFQPTGAAAPLPEVVGGMADTFARKVAQLTRERDTAVQERDQVTQERDQAHREIEQLRQRLTAAGSTPPAAAAAPARATPRSQGPPGAVFLVKNAEVNDMNGYYVESGSRNDRPQYKKYDNDKIEIYWTRFAWIAAFAGIAWRIGTAGTAWIAGTASVYCQENTQRPPCTGWKRRNDHSRSMMTIEYI
eukprot:m.156674 g.156674  ORF g.156674 m.156674 type:complete len:522 (-) comp11725_c0_seq9:89-1654(-)